MKRFLTVFCAMICIISLTALSGCQSTDYTALPDSYHKETDYPYLSCSTTSNMFSVAQTEQGIYFVGGDFLYFLDTQTKKAAIVCDRPDCRHDQETDPELLAQCNGYLGSDVLPFVQLYEDALYTITIDMEEMDPMNPFSSFERRVLTKISKDGVNREQICPIRVGSSSTENLLIHRGYVYYDVYKADSKVELYRVPLDKPDTEPELFFSKIGYSIDVFAYGSHVYVGLLLPPEDDVFCGELYDCSLVTGETVLIGEDIVVDGFWKDQLLIRSNAYNIVDYSKVSYQLLNRKTYECTPFLSLSAPQKDFGIGSDLDEQYFYERTIPLYGTQAYEQAQQQAQEKYGTPEALNDYYPSTLTVRDQDQNALQTIDTSFLSNGFAFVPGFGEYGLIWDLKRATEQACFIYLLDKNNAFSITPVLTYACEW